MKKQGINVSERNEIQQRNKKKIKSLRKNKWSEDEREKIIKRNFLIMKVAKWTWVRIRN